MTLEEVTRDLYGLEPGEFVAARTARARAAGDAGDKDLAAAIGKLRKPTVTAWTVDLLARAAPDEVAALLRLGTALQDAQRELSRDQLRNLTAQRQQMVNALAKRAVALAAEHDRPVGEAVLRKVGQTLTAALADPEVAERVRTGTLTTAATYEGFGLGPAGPELVLVAGLDTAEETGPPEETAADDSAQRELADALEALETARTARDSAQAQADRAADEVTKSESRISALREELAHAEQQKQFARTTERAAQEHLRATHRQLDRVERWADRARQRVDSK